MIFSLSGLLRPAWSYARKHHTECLELGKKTAESLGVKLSPHHCGTAVLVGAYPHLMDEMLSNPSFALENMCALAWATHTQIMVHSLQTGAINAVHETDVHELPDAAPSLFSGPFVIEARKDTGILCGESITGIGGYYTPSSDQWILFVIDANGGANVYPWKPAWGAGELTAGVIISRAKTLGTEKQIEEMRHDIQYIMRFLITFALLLDAEGTPLDREDLAENKRKIKKSVSMITHASHTQSPSDDSDLRWIYRYISLTQQAQREAREPLATPSPTDAQTPAARGLVPAVVQCRGHLRQQPHGAGRKLRKTVYIRAHSTRRWCRDAVSIVYRE